MKPHCLLVALLLFSVLLLSADAQTSSGGGGGGGGDSNDKLRKLLRHLTAHGMHMDGISVGPIEGFGRGVTAKRNLAKGERVLRIPLRLLVNIEHAMASPVGSLIDDYNLSDAEGMALYILFELTKPETPAKRVHRQDDAEDEDDAKDGDGAKLFEQMDREQYGAYRSMVSPLPYFETFPSTLPHVTVFFNSHDMALLKGSPVAQFTKDRRTSLQRKFETAKERMLHEKPALLEQIKFPLEHLSSGDFLWAMAIQFSRILTVHVKDAEGNWEKASCLVPIADMFNTAERSRLNVDCATNENSTHFECTTLRVVPRGEQLFAPYGGAKNELSNGQLLMDYGITFRNNPYDVVALDIPRTKETDRSYTAKLRILTALKLDKHFLQQLPPVKTFADVPKELVTALRVAVATDQELSDENVDEVFERIKQTINSFQPPISVENDIRALTMLRSVIMDKMSKYRTLLEDDEKMLAELDATPNPPINTVNALVVRIGEKRILASAARVLQERASELAKWTAAGEL